MDDRLALMRAIDQAEDTLSAARQELEQRERELAAIKARIGYGQVKPAILARVPPLS